MIFCVSFCVFICAKETRYRTNDGNTVIWKANYRTKTNKMKMKLKSQCQFIVTRSRLQQTDTHFSSSSCCLSCFFRNIYIISPLFLRTTHSPLNKRSDCINNVSKNKKQRKKGKHTKTIEISCLHTERRTSKNRSNT